MENKKCDQCEKSFLFENTLQLHIKTVHEAAVEAEDREQVKSSSKDKNLPVNSLARNARPRQNQHQKKQNASSNVTPKKSQTGSENSIAISSVQQCEKCSFKSSDSQLYWAHVVVEHPPEPSPVFYCGFTYCWFPFTSLRLKEAHEVTSHGALHLPFKCVLCKKNLVNKTVLENHKSKCIRKPLYKCPCPPCDFQSKRFGQLSKHVERTHQQDLLLVDKVRYTFHHPGWEKTSDCDLSTESEDVKSEEELGLSQHTFSSHISKAPDKELLDIKDCKTKEDIKSDEEEEIVLSGSPQTAPAPPPSSPFQCPYDNKQFPNWQHLHRHLHSSHLETGTDMVDCPLGQDTLSCICGRKTNCRDSLVIHCLRCVANMGDIVEGESRKEEDEEGLEKGWLVARRRARRKCKELGIKGVDAPSKTEKRMLEMCKKVSARELDMTGKKKAKAKEVIANTDNAVVEISDDDSNSETGDNVEGNHMYSSPVTIAPAKRKSALASNTNKDKLSRTSPRKIAQKQIVSVSSSEDQSSSEVETSSSCQIRVKCPICEKIFDRDVVMEHFCDYEVKEDEVLDVSSGSEIELSEEEDSTATTVSEATSEDEPPVKTNSNMLSMLADIRSSHPHVHKSQSNVVKLSTSSFSFDLTYSLPPTPGTPSPSTMSRQGNKRTRAKLKSRGRKGYVPTKHKFGLQFKK
eukprot:GFUD01009329.1.p1 GENE.GFUD01009329.1~~GFUD01009329.1.p1  ORF type:complete len:687 (-),score=205.49 GFUD01009329.1:81-2141(-)